MSLGKNIRRARLDAGYETQDDLAKALGVTRAAVSQWEGDKALPEPKRLADIVKILGRSWEWLSTGKEPESRDITDRPVNDPSTNVNESGVVVEEMPMTPDQTLLLREYDSLDEAAQAEHLFGIVRDPRKKGARKTTPKNPTTGRAS